MELVVTSYLLLRIRFEDLKPDLGHLGALRNANTHSELIIVNIY
jgi:hypothetical protein